MMLKPSVGKMCVRIWLEVGHACEPRRSANGRALALDWRVWVRGVSGRDISGFVHKVVFYLRPASAFVYPKRVLQEPPYEVQESGCASIDIPIHVYLKYTTKPTRIRLRYNLQIENNTVISSESRCVYYDLKNPPEELCEALMSSGGEVVARAAKRLVVVLSDEERTTMKPKKYKFIEPMLCKHVPRRRARALDESCPKCGESITADLRKQLRATAMSEDEINCVSRLYLAYTSYEKSVDALVLPPLSDPIYRVPEIPAALRKALEAGDSDYPVL
ncbi:Protein ENL [Operophtera brumata]|uniref:Protein ENL n=1 Tax=Operophtera brumata TaxID=104452 RepID=A0A0L7KTQ8_OPEBR|nr:Protein ENL [Operophtera brumata]